MLAVGFLGPAAAFVIPAISYAAVWIVDRYRWRALLINIAGSATPTFLVAVAFQAIDPPPDSLEFVVVLALVAAATMAPNFVIVLDDVRAARRRAGARTLRGAVPLIPAVLLNIALVAVIAEIYAELGLLALVFVLLNVIAFTYMARLVIVARERTRQYANLSWGVLSGLIRTLDERDSRAARHCAAVAALLARHRHAARHVQARPGARAHRGPAARHRQVRALRSRHGARRPARRGRLARHPPPPRHRRRAAARHRRLRPGRRDRAHAPRAPRRPRLPAPPAAATRSRRSRASSPSPRSTTRSPPRTPTARR